MQIISDCVICAVVVLTLGDFLFAFSVVLHPIKQEIESRVGISSLMPRGPLSWPATVLVREKQMGNNGKQRIRGAW